MKVRMVVLMMTAAMLVAGSFAVVAQEAVAPTEKQVLFNGKNFDGWVRFLPGDKDPDATWSIKPDGVVACAGRPAGYMRTEKDYKDYVFHVEYRWTGRTGNNGVLAHMTGPDTVWPKSLECQGMFRNQGDFFEIGGFDFNEHTTGGKRVRSRRVLKYGEHNEKEAGEWNTYEVWAVGDTVRPYINGKLMNEATGCKITAGKICLQSEGVPIEYRNIYIAPAKNKPWPVTPKEKIELFNGKDTTGWVKFIPEDKPDENKQWAEDKVWSVKDGVLRCEGTPNGYIRTEESYANYKLHVEWRWPEKAGNSGVLLHRAGIDKVWPMCIEAQLMNQSAGDFWMMSNATLEVDGKQVGPKKFAGSKKKGDANEKPDGEWNSYDIICNGGDIKLIVNGKVLNGGIKANPSSGAICLQSEGAPIEFRNIVLGPLD